MNKSDSERIATLLEKKGYKPALNIKEADLIVVNMCSVRQSAVDRIYGLANKFKKLKEEKPKLKTVLTGCILNKDRAKFTKKFDQILRFKDLLKYQPKRQDKSIAFVPISNGCNNFCTYCVVPFTRGSLICRNHQEILNEVKDLVKRGYKEIWLLGQNINHYRSKSKIKNPRRKTFGFLGGRQKSKVINFAKLLKMVNDIPGDFRIRFTSPHAADFTDELINMIAKCKKVAHYLHLPVQSGDNEILKKMGRPYTVEQYKNLVRKIRKKIPDINLSTDIIVGFPGETRNQFENTVKLMKEIEFNLAYISKYSPRSGTAAFCIKDNVPLKEKKRREKYLRSLLSS